MLLDLWLQGIETGLGWYVFFFFLLFFGIFIGFFFQRFKKFFYVVSVILFFLIGGRLILSGIHPLNWSKIAIDRFFWSPESWIFWLAMILSISVAGLVLLLKKGDYPGRFFAGFIVTINLYYSIIWLSNWVELIRFLRHLSFPAVMLLSFLVGIVCVGWQGLLRALSSLLGSSLLTIAYCEVLKRLGENDTFLGQSPFVLFIFLVGAVLMDAVQSRE